MSHEPRFWSTLWPFIFQDERALSVVQVLDLGPNFFCYSRPSIAEGRCSCKVIPTGRHCIRTTSSTLLKKPHPAQSVSSIRESMCPLRPVHYTVHRSPPPLTRAFIASQRPRSNPTQCRPLVPLITNALTAGLRLPQCRKSHCSHLPLSPNRPSSLLNEISLAPNTRLLQRDHQLLRRSSQSQRRNCLLSAVSHHAELSPRLATPTYTHRSLSSEQPTISHGDGAEGM